MSPRIKCNFSLNDKLPRSAINVILRLILGLYIMAYQTELAQAETALGNASPTLSYNLDNFKHYGPASQFLDITKSMRPWWGDMEDGSKSMSYEALKEGGYLDENGWVKEMPEGVEDVVGLWQWRGRAEDAYDVRGVYVLEYEGTGEVVMAGDARIISSEPGKIVFENMDGHNLYMKVRSTDPEGTGDYVRDVSIVAEENMPLYEAGAVYNPEWLKVIEDARELRFMSWGETNNSTVTSWDEHSSVDGMFWDAGVPVEYMVQLANEVGADPWFTMPHTADAEYIRNFATYVRDNLDPELKAKVEYSNEAWNWAFDQTEWLHDKAMEEWGTPALNDYYVKKSVETAMIWDEVFGSEADARLVKVLATQTRNPGLTERILEAKTWKQNEPDAYVAPGSIFDELAVTSYFGNNTVSDAEMRAELIEAIQDPDVDAMAYLAEKLMDPDYKGSIPQISDALAANAALAAEHGLKLSSYEGGQHVHHSFAVRDLSSEEITAMQDFMIEFVRSEEMGELYRELWDVWAEHSDGAFMQFGDVGTPSKSGSWSLYSGLEDSTPRSEALEELNRDTVAWWDDDRDGSQFQQGVISNGSESDDLLIGTGKIDYLLGMEGDDILIGGEGNDGLNGGDGSDRAVFSGTFADYTVRIEGDGYRVDGLDGSDFLINIEQLAFDGAQVISLSELIDSGDGTLVLSSLEEPLPEPIIITDGLLSSGQIKNGSEYDQVGIDDFSGNNEGIVIKTIFESSQIAQVLDITSADTAPSYISYINGSYEFYDLVQLVSNNLTTAGQSSIDMYGAAILMKAAKIVATDGDDSFYGGLADDVVSGGDGDDYLIGANGNDTLYGDAGDDQLLGHAGDDTLHGGDGNDKLNGGSGNDAIYAGSGDDVIYGGNGDDLVHGQDGDDRVMAGQGDDEVFGGVGDDTISGELGDDYLVGGSGDDTLYGNEGDDRLIGQAGDDTIHGGEGADHINGGAGNDTISGGSGNDKIYAGTNDDFVHGGTGDDYISGCVGNDILIGGEGKDQFFFEIGDGDDQINDFTQEDCLDLTNFFYAGQKLEDAASMDDGHLVLSNGEDRIALLGLVTEDLSWMNIDM